MVYRNRLTASSSQQPRTPAGASFSAAVARPCPAAQVWVGGRLWATTAEASNVNSDLTYSIGLTHIAVTGIAYWQVLLRHGSACSTALPTALRW